MLQNLPELKIDILNNSGGNSFLLDKFKDAPFWKIMLIFHIYHVLYVYKVTLLVFGCLSMLQNSSIHRNDPHNRKIHHKSDWRWCILHHIDIWIDLDCIHNLPRPHPMHNFAHHYKVENVEYISDLGSNKIVNIHPNTYPLNN